MNRKGILLTLFGIIALAQISVPAYMIFQREQILKHGQAFRFETALIDPLDAFRGRYVRLDFAVNRTRVKSSTDLKRGEWMYGELAENERGLATFSGLHAECPAQAACLRLRTPPHARRQLTIHLPFDRFYVEESKAPAAETAYREHARQNTGDSFAVIKIWRGRGVIEDLYVAGQPLLAYLREQGKPARN